MNNDKITISDFYVKNVNYNFLIDYLKLTISNNIDFRKADINLFRDSINQTEITNSKWTFQNYLKQDETLFVFLIDILKINLDNIYFVYGTKGYKFGVSDSKYHISFLGPKNKYDKETILIEFKGQTCRHFEEVNGNWKQLIQYVKNEFVQYNVSRLDLAFDVFTGEIELEDIFDKIRKKEYTSTARKTQIIEEFDNGVPIGQTCYIGNDNSDKQLCIYNKKLERVSTDHIVDVSKWLRFEFRLFHEFSKSAFVELEEQIDKLDIYILNSLMGFIRFKENKKNTRIENCDDWDKWTILLNNSQGHRILNQFKLEESFSRKKRWFNNNLIKMLCTFYSVDNNELFNQLKDKMYDKFEDLTQKDLNLINEFLLENGQKTLSKYELNEMKYHLKEIELINPTEIELINSDKIIFNDDSFGYYFGSYIYLSDGKQIESNTYPGPYFNNIYDKNSFIRRIERENKVIYEVKG